MTPLPEILPVDFSLAHPRRPLTEPELAVLQSTAPFTHRLLTTPGLTTPLLRDRCGGLWTRHLTAPPVRRHIIAAPAVGLLESAEAVFGDASHPWLQADKPLGPWLEGRGFTVTKEDIVPLLFDPAPELLRAFDQTAPAPFHGRQYRLVAVPPSGAPSGMPGAAAVMEVFRPGLDSLG